MKNLLKKLFGGLHIRWWQLILFAVICGVYTGVMAALPMARDTSFQDISITFECWVLFAIIIIVNGKTPLESALKTFVFFLVSQPLVYLVQVPFNELGWQLFQYYPPWFRWTLLTFPMAFVGHYMRPESAQLFPRLADGSIFKRGERPLNPFQRLLSSFFKNRWYSLCILLPMLAFLAYHYYSFFGEAVYFFPNHLLSALFCAVTMLLYPLCIFRLKKLRVAGAVFSAVLILAASVYGLTDGRSYTYDTQLLVSGGETCGVAYDDTYSVYLADESFGEVKIGYVESIEDYMILASFTKTGDTELVLVSPTGEQTVYELTVERYSYSVHRKE